MTLDPPASTQDLADDPWLDEDYLILSTIHSAKGLEWDSVFVIHAADGNIPSDMATDTPEEVEEERRLGPGTICMCCGRNVITFIIAAAVTWVQCPRSHDSCRHEYRNRLNVYHMVLCWETTASVPMGWSLAIQNRFDRTSQNCGRSRQLSSW